MSKDLLITTKNIIDKSNFDFLIYLGKWAIHNEMQAKLLQSNYEVKSYHWDDLKKRKSDNVYLRELNSRLLNDLVLFLNKYHNVDHPYRYWKIVIGPWLLYYTAMLYDRWETIRLFNHNSNDLTFFSNDIDYVNSVPDDYISFITLTQEDAWNNYLYTCIIKTFQKKELHTNINIKFVETLNDGLNIEEKKPWESYNNSSLFSKLVETADKIFSKLSAKNKILLYEVPFTKKAFIFLNLKLRQLPLLHNKTFSLNKNSYKKATLEGRKKINYSFTKINQKHFFESFLSERVFLDMPSAYIESYNGINNISKKIRLSPKLIVSAKGHWWNELFKIWIANKHLEGVKLIFTNHGGSIPVEFELNCHEEDSADVFFNWSRPFHQKHIQVPPSKFLLRKTLAPGNKFLVIGNETYRYPVLLTSGYMSADSLQSQADFYKMYEKLGTDIQNKLLFRPYANMGWDTASNFKKKLGETKVNRNDTLFNVFKKAKLIVCTYPETTFFEALSSGIPTLLLVDEKWEFSHNFDVIVDLMYTTKIIFKDPYAAAKHINDIWDSPSIWWDSEQMKQVRDEISKWIGDTSDGVSKWVELLKKEIK
jgi:putative transferase (TIGR04331 family)